MTQPQHELVDEQAELFTSLLEGESPGVYVFTDIPTLVTQIKLAIRETNDSAGRPHADRAAFRLIRTLTVLGFVHNTKFGQAEQLDKRPHAVNCNATVHAHGTGCSVSCPTCGGRA